MKKNQFKKILLGVCCLIILISLASCKPSDRAEWLEKSNSKDEKQVKETMQSIIDALNAKDASALKKLFSPYALKNANDLDTQIEKLISVYPGCRDGFDVSYNTHRNDNRGVSVFAINATCTIKNGTQKYNITFSKYVHNDEDKEKEGLHLIEAAPEEALTNDFKWKDEEDAPGVYVVE